MRYSRQNSQTATKASYAITFLLALLLIGCGGSTPTAPTPPPTAQVAGTWTGTFESSNFAQLAITMALTQSGTGVNGTWAVQSFGWTGTIQGTVDPSTFSGTFTFNGASTGTGTCTGTGSFSGNASVSTMTWASPGFTGGCTGMPLAVRLVLQRR